MIDTTTFRTCRCPKKNHRQTAKRFRPCLFLPLLILAMATSASNHATAARTVVFTVHGTFAETSNWMKIVPEKMTFTSEVQRGFGKNCVIKPFLWQTSTHHKTRVTAAKRLAKQLDLPEFQNDTIVIIAHSHGGNVALEAVGRCNRKIKTVICLSTPHAHLLTKNAKGKILISPVYCNPAARRRIGDIITVSPKNDIIVNQFASLIKGIDKQTAFQSTCEWRTAMNSPRLVNDAKTITDLLQGPLGKRPTPILTMGPKLTIADRDIRIGSNANGIQAHSAVHSYRMGFILGLCIRDNFSRKQIADLTSLQLPADEDPGEPISPASYNAWMKRHAGEKKFSG